MQIALRIWASLALLAWLLVGAGAAEKKTVIPFDFESRFDEGRYGAIVGDMLWKKLSRDAQFVVPESMHDVRAVCEQLKFHPGPATSLAEMKKVVREEFEADIAVWDRDPYTVSTVELKEMRCELTVFNGKVVFERKP